MFPPSILLILVFCSTERAQASHVYSYRHGFKGFAAKLTEQQASEMASQSFSFFSLFFPSLLVLQLIFLLVCPIISSFDCWAREICGSGNDRYARRGLCVSQFKKKAAHHSFVGFHGSRGRRNHGNSRVFHQESRKCYHWFHWYGSVLFQFIIYSYHCI